MSGILDGLTADPVTATEFVRDFGRYRVAVHHKPIPVTSHGNITGYFVDPVEFERYLRLRTQAFTMSELSPKTVEQLKTTRMDSKFNCLNSELED